MKTKLFILLVLGLFQKVNSQIMIGARAASAITMGEISTNLFVGPGVTFQSTLGEKFIIGANVDYMTLLNGGYGTTGNMFVLEPRFDFYFDEAHYEYHIGTHIGLYRSKMSSSIDVTETFIGAGITGGCNTSLSDVLFLDISNSFVYSVPLGEGQSGNILARPVFTLGYLIGGK